MLAKVTSCAVVGLEGALIQVEVDIARGLPTTTIVGLPDAGVNESKERVRSAVRNGGCYFPNTGVTIDHHSCGLVVLIDTATRLTCPCTIPTSRRTPSPLPRIRSLCTMDHNR